MISSAVLTTILGGFATLAIFSFIIKENPFYRFFEHLFIGIAAGFGVMGAIKQFVWPVVLVPLFGLDIMQFPDGTQSEPYNPWLLLYVIPLLFGTLYYFIFSRQRSWIAQIVIGFTLGTSGGIAFQGFFNEMLPQIFSSFKPLVVFVEGEFSYIKSLENIAFVATLICVMYYFFFTFKRKSEGKQAFASSGRFLMMICFGAFFGSTVMARMSLLVERLLFLYGDWWSALSGLVS